MLAVVIYGVLPMYRFVIILLCAFAIFSIGASPVAHAAEQTICAESTGGEQASDQDQDRQGPGTNGMDKGIQHQHGGCHGHHFASLSGDASVDGHGLSGSSQLPSHMAMPHGAAPNPALRPPKA